MANAPEPKRHHYIPQYYLKGFTEPQGSSLIWVYEKATGRRFATNTSNVAVEKHFYAFDHPNGTRDNSHETWLAEKIEAPANSVLDKIRAREPITEQDRWALCVYIGIMHKRVPAHREESKQLVPQVIADLEEKIRLGRMPELPTQGQRDIGLAILRDYAKATPRHFLLPSLSLRVALAFSAMAWTCFTCDTGEGFITSDNPVFFDKGIGIGDDDSEVSFPIAQDIALWATRRQKVKEKYEQADRATVRELNRRTASTASRHVFYGQEAQWVSDLIARRKHQLNRIILNR